MFVCGSARQMPKDVRETLVQIASAHGVDGEHFVREMEKQRRYSIEVWS